MRTYKYGVEIPHTIEEAKAIDEKTGTVLWMDSITKEQTNSGCAFKFNSKDAMPKGYTKIAPHIVFNMKLGMLARKARLCTDRHKVPGLPKKSTYISVPSRDLVRIFFLLGALNGLEVLSADIQNAYLAAPLAPGVKYYTIAKEANGFTAKAVYHCTSSIWITYCSGIFQSLSNQTFETARVSAVQGRSRCTH